MKTNFEPPAPPHGFDLGDWSVAFRIIGRAPDEVLQDHLDELFKFQAPLVDYLTRPNVKPFGFRGIRDSIKDIKRRFPDSIDERLLAYIKVPASERSRSPPRNLLIPEPEGDTVKKGPS